VDAMKAYDEYTVHIDGEKNPSHLNLPENYPNLFKPSEKESDAYDINEVEEEDEYCLASDDCDNDSDFSHDVSSSSEEEFMPSSSKQRHIIRTGASSQITGVGLVGLEQEQGNLLTEEYIGRKIVRNGWHDISWHRSWN
jgi:hypothetical protein